MNKKSIVIIILSFLLIVVITALDGFLIRNFVLQTIFNVFFGFLGGTLIAKYSLNSMGYKITLIDIFKMWRGIFKRK
jgi:hypothetical protein